MTAPIITLVIIVASIILIPLYFCIKLGRAFNKKPKNKNPSKK